jgi:hypothetical protein
VTYDPKAKRPAPDDTDDAAPVDQLLGAGPVEAAVTDPAGATAAGSSGPDVEAPGTTVPSPPAVTPEPAPLPEPLPAKRTVATAVAAAVAVAIVLLGWRRRRRR